MLNSHERRHETAISHMTSVPRPAETPKNNDASEWKEKLL
jgi:hypothetical protein